MTVFQRHGAIAGLTEQNCALLCVHLSIPMQTFYTVNRWSEREISVLMGIRVQRSPSHFPQAVSKQNCRAAFKRSDCRVVVQSAGRN